MFRGTRYEIRPNLDEDDAAPVQISLCATSLPGTRPNPSQPLVS